MEKQLYSLVGIFIISVLISLPLVWVWNIVFGTIGFTSMSYWQMVFVSVLVKIVYNIIEKCK